MLVGWMVYVHFIIFLFGIVLWSPSPILDISGNLFLWFIDSPGFNIIKSLNINLVGFTSFSVGEGLVYINSFSFKYTKDINCVLYNLDKIVVSAIILSSLGSVFIEYSTGTMLLYFSVAFWMSYPARTSFPVYQSYLVLSMKLFKV